MWTTNLAAFAIGFAMFGSFVLIPQLVQTPDACRLRLRRTTTVAGLFLLPSALVMLVRRAAVGRLGSRFGSRLPLALGAALRGLGYFWLALFHARAPRSPSARSCSASGSASRSPRWRTSSSRPYRQEQTGVASGINTIMRSIGGAIGAQVAAAIVGGHLILGGRFPAESGFTEAFAMSARAAIVALVRR